ncbi:hypothetical protein TVAG_070320 [Trichomonas vaginalis G3]|uniref:Piwi domain-containing protein n=1 Tax=Trichomonas vaginalis (strain ATCC PRA-98 / G3) TaxID=412133 RepID=A2D7T6_TRIV3|nr:hypothetical protein TVAGG3_1044740 [Trichomonas vaginalis G3]EAY23369.1 hypothetical protein TVAG_070320 [Trichomonas vaginalis G3]KAI5493784.1 hypothetical protein TVAGG3_1044740 [Trichomonas vaginalis G3]|eukprot:XP_001584355.1 hypothetical protein [Trichomonas vaginalis G3]
MEAGQWNLSTTPFRGFTVLQINSKILPTDESKESLKSRLLLLSHQLARKNIPAYCLNKSPEYSPKETEDPIVIAFDLFNQIEEFEFPVWSELFSWVPTIDKNIKYSFLDDMQKAINLSNAYKLSYLNPVYFWTFLYFEIPDSPCNNFIYQNIPVYSQDGIYIRRFITTQPTSYLSRHSRIQPKQLVLIPPYVHPFYVQSVSTNRASCVSITKKVIHVPFENQTFVTFTKWPNSIYRFSRSGHNEVEIEKKIEQTDYQTDFYEGVEEGIEQFFANNFCDVEEPPQVLPKEFVAFPTMNAYELIDEMIVNYEERKSLKKMLQINPIFPKLIDQLLLPRIPFISPLSTDTSIPYASSSLGPMPNQLTSFEGRHLGIPNCLVRQNGRIIQVPVNTCYQNWEENVYSPINGPQNTKYYVYVIGQVTSAVKIFFKELESYYSSLQLGELIPSLNCFETTTEPTLNMKINQRFQTEFNVEQPTIFIVHPIVFGCNIDAHVITTPIMDCQITEHSEDFMKNLALLIYTRLRSFKSEPFGNLYVSAEEVASLFFGFKFHTPFIIQRPNESTDPIRLHIAWDPDTKLSTWCDDTCQFFHTNRSMDIAGIRETFKKIRNGIKDTNISVVMCIVDEGISESLYNEFMAEDFLGVSDFCLISVFPSPAVQAFFNNKFDDDIIVQSPCERIFDSPEGGYITPLSTCFVVPHNLTPYTVSMFSHQSDDDWNALVNVTKELSNMSWTAACFGADKRLSALPIHVRSLLRKARKTTLTVARFEFLPPRNV